VSQTNAGDGCSRARLMRADDDALYRWFLLYEAKCAEAGVRVIRIFRQFEDAERGLEIVSAAHELA
jgi:hypothetical protein